MYRKAKLVCYKASVTHSRFYYRPWQDHSRLKIVKRLIKIMWFVADEFVPIQSFPDEFVPIQSFPDEFVPIQSFPDEFVPIQSFPDEFWSEWYRSYGKNDRIYPDSFPIFPNAIRQRSDSDYTMNRRWRKASVRKPFQVILIRLLTNLNSIQQNLSRHTHDCNPTRQTRLCCPNVTGCT